MGKNTYFYILEGKKEKGKTKQRVIKYLGTLSGDINTLISKLEIAKEALQKLKEKSVQ